MSHTGPGCLLGPNRKGGYNVAVSIPAEIHGQKYISLTTFRRSGAAVPTPVWFGEKEDRLYVMTRSDSGKCKRIRHHSGVRIAPCTLRGKITGAEFAATARVLPPHDWPWARQTILRKYWLARVPFLWSKTDACLEIDVAA